MIVLLRVSEQVVDFLFHGQSSIALSHTLQLTHCMVRIRFKCSLQWRRLFCSPRFGSSWANARAPYSTRWSRSQRENTVLEIPWLTYSWGWVTMTSALLQAWGSFGGTGKMARGHVVQIQSERRWWAHYRNKEDNFECDLDASFGWSSFFVFSLLQK